MHGNMRRPGGRFLMCPEARVFPGYLLAGSSAVLPTHRGTLRRRASERRLPAEPAAVPHGGARPRVPAVQLGQPKEPLRRAARRGSAHTRRDRALLQVRAFCYMIHMRNMLRMDLGEECCCSVKHMHMRPTTSAFDDLERLIRLRTLPQLVPALRPHQQGHRQAFVPQRALVLTASASCWTRKRSLLLWD